MSENKNYTVTNNRNENNDNTEKTPVVDFDLLVKLTTEYKDRCGTFAEVIAMLEMNEVPMSPAVRRLGVVTGILIE